MSARTGTSPLDELRPSVARVVGVVLAGASAVALAHLAGAATPRALVLGAAVVGTLLVLRLGGPDEHGWPEPAPRRTRPGRHTVVTTARQLEGAVTEAGDRAAVVRRVEALERTATTDTTVALRAHLRTGRRSGPTTTPEARSTP